jgi:hypothetical protein
MTKVGYNVNNIVDGEDKTRRPAKETFRAVALWTAFLVECWNDCNRRDRDDYMSEQDSNERNIGAPVGNCFHLGSVSSLSLQC